MGLRLSGDGRRPRDRRSDRQRDTRGGVPYDRRRMPADRDLLLRETEGQGRMAAARGQTHLLYRDRGVGRVGPAQDIRRRHPLCQSQDRQRGARGAPLHVGHHRPSEGRHALAEEHMLEHIRHRDDALARAGRHLLRRPALPSRVSLHHVAPFPALPGLLRRDLPGTAVYNPRPSGGQADDNPRSTDPHRDRLPQDNDQYPPEGPEDGKTRLCSRKAHRQQHGAQAPGLR